MVREIDCNELTELLELYLHLHENTVPDTTEILNNAWNAIVQDKNHQQIKKQSPKQKKRHLSKLKLQATIFQLSYFPFLYKKSHKALILLLPLKEPSDPYQFLFLHI